MRQVASPRCYSVFTVMVPEVTRIDLAHAYNALGGPAVSFSVNIVSALLLQDVAMYPTLLQFRQVCFVCQHLSGWCYNDCLIPTNYIVLDQSRR